MFDIYKKKEENYTYIGSIKEEELIYLQPIFNNFYKLTGYKIDEYYDTVIDNSAINNLIALLSSSIINNENNNNYRNSIINKYVKVFEVILKEGADLIFLGD